MAHPAGPASHAGGTGFSRTYKRTLYYPQVHVARVASVPDHLHRDEEDDEVVNCLPYLGRYTWGVLHFMADTFPCPKCAAEFSKWMRAFHDYLNARLGKPFFDPENFAAWRDEMRTFFDESALTVRTPTDRFENALEALSRDALCSGPLCGTCDGPACVLASLPPADGVPGDPDTQAKVQAAVDTIAVLNGMYGLSIQLRPVGLGQLTTFGLNPRYLGFVLEKDPAIMYIVPENIPSIEESIKTVKHEFRHNLDLAGGCPQCSPGERERRARDFEDVIIPGIAARDDPAAVIGQQLQTLGVPNRWGEWLSKELARRVELLLPMLRMDANTVRLKFLIGPKAIGGFTPAFLVLIRYNVGDDLYEVTTSYFDGSALELPIKSATGIFADQLDDPSIFFNGGNENWKDVKRMIGSPVRGLVPKTETDLPEGLIFARQLTNQDVANLILITLAEQAEKEGTQDLDIPAGTLYAPLMTEIDAATFDHIVDTLGDMGFVTRSGQRIRTGPKFGDIMEVVRKAKASGELKREVSSREGVYAQKYIEAPDLYHFLDVVEEKIRSGDSASRAIADEAIQALWKVRQTLKNMLIYPREGVYPQGVVTLRPDYDDALLAVRDTHDALDRLGGAIEDKEFWGAWDLVHTVEESVEKIEKALIGEFTGGM